MNIIGRKDEIYEIKRLYSSKMPQFLAVYGRRRVGKTFLIDEALKGKITFRHSGLSPVDEPQKQPERTTEALLFVVAAARHEEKQMPYLVA